MFNILNKIKDIFIENDEYASVKDAVIIACYYNPENSQARRDAWNKWYATIKHLNHRVIECVIGNGKRELPTNSNITSIHTEDLLWHKETLLNKIISELPANFKYVFWMDTDVIFTDKDWIKKGVAALEINKVIQPFEYCVHLEQSQTEPNFDVKAAMLRTDDPKTRQPNMWRSFCSNYKRGMSDNINYDIHGHVGLVWGARRSVLDAVKLYDRALIGGADHILAHAAAGQIPHNCIERGFVDGMEEIIAWSKNFYRVVRGDIGYVPGNIAYHLWHGDLKNREYLKRVQEFTPHVKTITEKDANGLYKHSNDDTRKYVKTYYQKRESVNNATNNYNSGSNIIEDIIIAETIFGSNNNTQQDPAQTDSNFGGFGGGQTDGGGAGGSWDNNQNNSSSDGSYPGGTFS